MQAGTLNIAAGQEQELFHSGFPFWHRYSHITLLPFAENLTVWVPNVVRMNFAVLGDRRFVLLDPDTPFVQLCIGDERQHSGSWWVTCWQ